MAQNKTGTQGMGGKPGGQSPSKGGSQKQSGGSSRKSSMKEDEKENASSGKGTMNK